MLHCWFVCSGHRCRVREKQSSCPYKVSWSACVACCTVFWGWNVLNQCTKCSHPHLCSWLVCVNVFLKGHLEVWSCTGRRWWCSWENEQTLTPNSKAWVLRPSPLSFVSHVYFFVLFRFLHPVDIGSGRLAPALLWMRRPSQTRNLD